VDDVRRSVLLRASSAGPYHLVFPGVLAADLIAFFNSVDPLSAPVDGVDEPLSQVAPRMSKG